MGFGVPQGKTNEVKELSEDVGLKIEVPKDISWNYNLRVFEHSEKMLFEVELGDPKPFFHPCHERLGFHNAGLEVAPAEGESYIIPASLVEKFFCLSNHNRQIVGFLYGYEEREISFIVMVPQWEYLQQFHVASISEDQIPDGLKPLGFIRTQSEERNTVTPLDILFHCSQHLDENAVNATLSLASKRSLKLYKLTHEAFEWGNANRGKAYTTIDLKSFPAPFCDVVHSLVTSKGAAHFMVPKGISWNYNLRVLEHSENMLFEVELGDPKPFFHPCH